VIESATMAGDLLRGPGGLFARLGGLARTARAKALVGELHWSLHVSVDGSETEATAGIEAVARRALAAGGEAIPEVIPRVTRARPFRRIKALLGPDGEVWLPLHGVFSAERAVAGLAAAQAVLADAGTDMAAHGVRCVILAVLMGMRVIVEPQLFWHDALSAVHRRLAQPDQVAAYGGRAARPEARAFAWALRQRLTAALDSAGAAHFQIGRAYAWPAGARDAFVALKARFDPDGIMNPGVLGL
jgi:D-lactate dehydrogenase (cytochrome)